MAIKNIVIAALVFSGVTQAYATFPRYERGVNTTNVLPISGFVDYSEIPESGQAEARAVLLEFVSAQLEEMASTIQGDAEAVQGLRTVMEDLGVLPKEMESLPYDALRSVVPHLLQLAVVYEGELAEVGFDAAAARPMLRQRLRDIYLMVFQTEECGPHCRLVAEQAVAVVESGRMKKHMSMTVRQRSCPPYCPDMP